MFNPILSALLRGTWLIDEQFANNSLPLVLGLLQGKLNGSEFLNGSGDFEGPFFMVPGKGKVNAYKFTEGVGMTLNSEPVIAGTIAVVPFIGAVTKYNGQCGEPGMIKRQQWISDMCSVPGVAGYISLLDTPGGQADGTPQTADLINSLPIPTVAVIIGGAYSAGAWVAAAHNAIYAADKYSGFGSIGAYTTIFDYRGYFEKQGYKVTAVYPKVSKDKNLSYRQAIDGNTEMIEKEIGDMATSFIEAITEFRTGKLTSDEWNTGKCFSAQEAVTIGLIDGIKPFNQVVEEIRSGSFLQQSLTNNPDMNTKNVLALAGSAEPTEESLSLANADLCAAGITAATLVQDSFITEAAAATSENASLKDQVTALTSQLSEKDTALSAAQTTISDLQSQVEAFGKNAGSLNKQTAGADTHADEDNGNDDPSSYSHNKAANAFLS